MTTTRVPSGMGSSAFADQVSDPIRTLPFMFPTSIGTVTTPSFPTRDSATVVEGGSGAPSLLYSRIVSAVTGTATATATSSAMGPKRSSGQQ